MFCYLCESRILDTGEDSYLIFEHQLSKIFIDEATFKYLKSSRGLMGHRNKGYELVCRDCLVKGYVSPFNTRKTNSATSVLSEEEISIAQLLARAMGKGEDIYQYLEKFMEEFKKRSSQGHDKP